MTVFPSTTLPIRYSLLMLFTHFSRELPILSRFSCLFLTLAALFAVPGCVQDPPPAPEAPKVTDDLDAVKALEVLKAEIRKDADGHVSDVNFKGTAATAENLKPLAAFTALRSLTLDGVPLSDSDLEILTTFKGPLASLNLRNCKITDAALDHLAKIPTLRAIRLSGESGDSSLTDEGLAKLTALKSLKVLALDHLWIGTAGIDSLTTVSTIEELYLSNTLIDDSTLEVLQKFPALKKLRLSQTQISNDGLKHLVACRQLEELDLSENSLLSDDGLASVGQITSLKKLNLWRVGVSNAGIVKLSPLTKMEWLNLDNTQLSDEGLVALKDMKSLVFLHLGSTSVSDAGLPSLYELSVLKDLKVTRTSVTEAGVTALKEKLPNTEVQLKYAENL